MPRGRVEAGADALDGEQRAPRRLDVQQVDGPGAPADGEPRGGRPVDGNAERPRDVVRAPRRQQRGGWEAGKVEVGERVHGPVAADEHDPAVAGVADGGGELHLAGGHPCVHARARGPQLARRPLDHVVRPARVAVHEQLDVAADDRERSRPRADRRARCGARCGAVVEGGVGAHGQLVDRTAAIAPRPWGPSARVGWDDSLSVVRLSLPLSPRSCSVAAAAATE
jgi:hypothetical protein